MEILTANLYEHFVMFILYIFKNMQNSFPQMRYSYLTMAMSSLMENGWCVCSKFWWIQTCVILAVWHGSVQLFRSWAPKTTEPFILYRNSDQCEIYNLSYYVRFNICQFNWGKKGQHSFMFLELVIECISQCSILFANHDLYKLESIFNNHTVYNNLYPNPSHEANL